MTDVETTEEVPAVDEPRDRFRDLVAAEWIKLWSLRSTVWAIVVSALAVVGFNSGAAYEDYLNWPQWDAAMRAEFVPEWAMLDAFTDAAALSLMLSAGTVGALAILGEYSTGLNRTTFAAVPARSPVMAAKVIVVAGIMAVFGVVVSAASFGLTQAILSGRHAGLSLSSPGAVRVVVASALLAPLAGLVGMAVGSVLRHSAITMFTFFVVLLLMPMGISDDRHWSAVIDHTLPYSAWVRLVQVGDDPVAFPWSIAGAWTVYAGWALGAAVVAVASVHRRDQ